MSGKSKSILLLSSSYPRYQNLLTRRKNLARSLAKQGFDPVVMEAYEFPKALEKRTLFKKFMHLLNRKFQMISVIIPRNAQMHGVVFELALILAKIDEEGFEKKVRFFAETNTDIQVSMPEYTNEYIRKMNFKTYNDWSDLEGVIRRQFFDINPRLL